jgi:hypothetical protein
LNSNWLRNSGMQFLFAAHKDSIQNQWKGIHFTGIYALYISYINKNMYKYIHVLCFLLCVCVCVSIYLYVYRECFLELE